MKMQKNWCLPLHFKKIIELFGNVVYIFFKYVGEKVYRNAYNII